MASRNRKRIGNTAAVGGDVPGDVSKKTTSRSRQAIKIEFEPDVNNEEKPDLMSLKDGIEVPMIKSETGDGDTQTEGPTQVLKSEDATASGSTDAATTPAKNKRSKREPLKVEPPSNWQKVLENIKIMRSTKTAAVDTMGCERTADLTVDPKIQRFQTLVSLMLSSQTKDQVTYAAMERLKARGLTVQSMLDVDEKELGDLLNPVSFYKRKSIYIKKAAKMLRDSYADDIPATVEDLMSLPGVGPKMAYICMNAAWNENVGIGVDTHVHRIANRLKWTGVKGTNDPEKTREALESWMPKELWQETNILLVGFGQEICRPVGPKCDTCLNKDICPSSTAKTKKPKKLKA
ncbi:unnamed protein product [Orchesella dallaii]